jgi:hypothetical protein
MMVDPGNAAALVVALADLAHVTGDFDLTDCDRADIATVHAALAPWLAADPDDELPGFTRLPRRSG